MPAETQANACADCQTAEATLEIRNRELCRDCFIRYVNSKVLKRMESYRFKNLKDDRKRKLLIPLSGGVSSMTLLQVLDAQLRKQLASRNRTSYELVAIHVAEVDGGVEPNVPWFDDLKSRFLVDMPQPHHHLSDVFQLDPSITDDLKHLGVELAPGQSADEQLQKLMNQAKSVTAGADIQDILLTRLVVAFAKEQDCEAILWGHSDSRLAAKALAGVAKGRGGALTLDICDGMTPWNICFNYPLRDLLQSELITYTSVLPETFPGLRNRSSDSRSATSIRHTSIDDLLTTYIFTQGQKYPSIMANVVRTVSKLQSPELGQEVALCAMCRMPTTSAKNEDRALNRLCYACTRTKQDV